MGWQARAGAALTLAALAGTAAASPDVIISEIMVNPSGSDYAREYLELYNRGTSPISLDGWTVGDSTDMDRIVEVSSGLLLQPGHYALILDPSYFEANEPYIGIPPEALIVTIEDGAFSRSGFVNSRANTVLLRAPNGSTQEVYYDANAVATEGYSLEKIDLDGDDGVANWAVSRVFDGTPGRANSRRRLGYDIALAEVWADPDTVHPPADVVIHAKAYNFGRNMVQEVLLVVFADADGDSLLSARDERLAETEMVFPWWADILSLRVAWRVFAPPAHAIWATLVLPRDEAPWNNTRRVELAVGLPPRALRITEIMADPPSREGQWVEVANVGTTAIPLAGCKLVTYGSPVAVAAPPPILAPRDLIVLAQYPDSLRLRYGVTVAVAAVHGSFPRLSTSAGAARRVSLLDATDAVADSAHYPVPEPGRSLELVAWDKSGEDPTAWQTAWGPVAATPGLPNQAMVPRPEEGALVVGPTPPADTVGLSLALPETPVWLTVRVYDVLGREVRRVVDGERWPAHSYLRWDGLDSGGNSAPTGMYVLLVEATTESGKRYRLVRSVVIARRR